ncbi:hypothetical protein V9T40_005371 [Parthenolecanium corni]|uniref:Integrase catalytic domain-containing protein n=1 Tax=Parthenolecanium corni TaxID=536013 RepID=A0AAN9Y3I9_9HEMI
MASSSSGNPRIKRFDGTHFLAWRNRVYTELQCDDLTDFVDKRPTDELKKKTYGTDKKPLTWVQGDARARRVILENLEDSLLHYAPPESSAFEVWRKLKVTYNRSSYLQHAYLRRKLYNLQYNGRGDLGNFFREFDDVVAEIRSGGGKVGRMDDIEVVVSLLASLPSEYSPVVASFGEINENALVTTEFVKGVLLDYDLKRKDEQRQKKTDVVEKVSTAYFSDSNTETAYMSDSKTSSRGKLESKTERPHCNYCGRDGHKEARCFKKKGDRRSNGEVKGANEANVASGEIPRTVAFLAENGDHRKSSCKEKVISVEIVFVSDSGCTRFMVNDRTVFTSYEKLKIAVPITLADSSTTHATHAGTVELISNLGYHITFTDVLYVPNLRHNLLSVRRIALRDYEVIFRKDTVAICKDSVDLASGYVENDLYYLKFCVCSAEAGISEESLSYEQVHRRLGHPGQNAISNLRKLGLVQWKGEASGKCEACIEGKQSQQPYPTSHFRASRPLERVVSDVCFGDRVSFDGYEYFVTFMDVYTHFSIIFLLKKKSEVFEKFVEYEALVTSHFGVKIGSFMCDNGKEYVNSSFIDFCKKKGIRVLNTVPYNHPQNGKAERLNRTLEDLARTVLGKSGAPKSFWSEAVLYSNYCLNRLPTTATGKVPASVWYNRDADYSKLRPFGCVCYVHIPQEKRSKFESHSQKGVMMGYAEIGYRIYDVESQKIVVARNVIFDEGRYYRDLFEVESRGRSRSEDDSDSDSDADTTLTSATQASTNSPVTDEVDELRRSSRERKLPSHFDDFEVTIGYCEALLTENPYDSKWDAPKRLELECIKNFGVWSLVPRPENVKVIRSKWALQEKPGKLKARLVAVGCDEKDAPDFLFSPVVNTTTVKMFLSLVVQKGLMLHQMDVSSAFLHGDLDYEVYMEQPPGFCKDRGLVCKLHKAIYGLKVSPRIWNRCFNEFMCKSMSFSRSGNDFCLYRKFYADSELFVLVYVDDLLIASDSESLIASFKTKISKRFSIVDLGKIRKFLGMDVNYNVKLKIMTLSQAEFICKVAKRFNLEDSKPVYTPIERDLNVTGNVETKVDLPFRQLVGCLLYISLISRPDVSFAVNFFSRFMNSFTEELFNYLKRVVVYLVHSKELKLTYSHSSVSPILECFVDADWAADTTDRKSVSGCAVKLFGNIVLWSSKKQSSIALSSTESEYISLSTFIHDSFVWMVEVLKDFRIVVKFPVVIYEDNQSVISLSANPITSKRSKHIDVRFKYVKEMILDGTIKLEYLSTDKQVADGFTKGLARPKFESFRAMLHVE